MTMFCEIVFAAGVPLWFWVILWKIVLIGALILFGGMAVWVSIGGFFDIKRLFRRITESHQQQEE
jgi:hypothetical protein